MEATNNGVEYQIKENTHYYVDYEEEKDLLLREGHVGPDLIAIPNGCQTTKYFIVFRVWRINKIRGQG